MEGKELLFKLSNSSGVSGHECNLHQLLKSYFKTCSDEISTGRLGDFIALKKGSSNGLKVMIAAHADEIGMMVTGVDDRGFVHFTGVENIDPKTIMAQEVLIYGRQEVYGVIGSRPLHVMSEKDRECVVGIDDMLIDTGKSMGELTALISPGDTITIKRECAPLLNDFITGKALDNRAGICAMYECAKELKNREHGADVYYVASTMEETGCTGVKVDAYSINPDVAIAVDVTFRDKYADKDLNGECSKGVEIAVGPNTHPHLTKKLIEVAKDKHIPYFVEAYPGSTGTDAWSTQVAREGIPSLVISIPLRYMHSSTEVISYSDVEYAGRLLTEFICCLKDWRDEYVG